MIDIVELKRDAKERLNNVLGESIKICLIGFAISIGFSIIVALINNALSIDKESLAYQITDGIQQIIYGGLFSLGFLNFFLKISRGKDATYDELFSKTGMFWKAITAQILMSLLISLGVICLIIPGIIIAFSLSLTYFVLLDNPEMGVIDAMGKSNEMMKGYKMDYFMLLISFIGWILLGLLTLGFLYLWLIPYMEISTSIFYNKVKLLNKKI